MAGIMAYFHPEDGACVFYSDRKDSSYSAVSRLLEVTGAQPIASATNITVSRMKVIERRLTELSEVIDYHPISLDRRAILVKKAFRN